MSQKMRSGKAVWIMAAAVMITALLLIILFAVKATPNEKESIVLPSAPLDQNENAPQNDEAAYNDDFVAVTRENVLTVLQTLNRPAAYHQSYAVTVGSEGNQNKKTVELWVKNGLIHAEVNDSRQKQSLISDGTVVYLWYDGSSQYITLELPPKMTPEDVLGLPDFDAYLKLAANTVAEADYLLLEEPQVQCIYVSAHDENESASRHWINLENGLMYQAEATDGDKLVYSVVQTGFDVLSDEDEAFAERFVLPDRTAPFTEEIQTPQP